MRLFSIIQALGIALVVCCCSPGSSAVLALPVTPITGVFNGLSTSAPKANFKFSPSAPLTGQTVTFTDISSGSPTSWSWNFGDGSASTSQNSTHVYSTAGNFTVSLTASDAGGSSSASKAITVAIPPPKASFTDSPGSPNAGQLVTFTDTSTGSPTSWSWTFGDGSTSTAENPNHTYSAAGTFTVTLTASNAGGTSSASKSVTVKPVAPVASFTFSPSATTTGQQVTFRDTSAFSPTGWSWYFGDGYSGTSQSPTHIYPSAGSFTVYLTARNAQGSNTTCSTVTISQAPGSFDGSILLGSPEATSIKANVFSADESGSAWISYGTSSGTYTNQTTAATLSAGVPIVITLSQLAANTQYYYRLNFQAAGGSSVVATQKYTFHTARPAGSTFTFTIQADSHLDENSILDLYHRTLGNISAEQPDFHIDLGDTFMCEKNCTPFTGVEQEPTSQAQVTTRYIYERGNYGIITPSVPLFLTNGNHDGEAGWLANGTAQSIPVWTTLSRQTYFLNPIPDSFYGGDSTSYPFVGQRAAWYAWQWGDALFIVLDPFWNATGTVTNGWNLTLGATQFNWLQRTLASSSAKFKFVFIHDLVGGLQGQMRGGVEAAPFYEWGGENSDGTAGFSQNRPGWSMPIDQLFTTYGVTALFHGHDHLYDHQALNGVAYQEVPQPSADDYQSGPALAADYGYVSGTILSSSGHMLVTVSPTGVTIQYIRAWLPIWETGGQINGQVADNWSAAAP